MKMRMTLLGITVTSLLMFSACMNLGRSTTTRYYLLESKAEEIMISTGIKAHLSDISLGIGPVVIPPYLDRPQLVSRLSNNELRVDEFSQWAEPFKDNITRVIEESLSVLTGSRHIHPFPKRRSVVIDYQISLDVLRFDADDQGRVTLKSAWRIVNSDDHQPLMERRTTIVQPSDSSDTERVVDAMSMALTQLSHEIAQAMAELAANSPKTIMPGAS